jgi:xylulokinase
MSLVAGVDSSTQSCKVVVRDAESGRLVRSGRAPHPPGTEVDPEAWWAALQQAVSEAGGIDDVSAIAVGGQQHGMVCLDEDGAVVRPALLWNDTRSAQAAADLAKELGDGAAGARAWVEAVGVVPVASFTVAKLRWLADHEPDHARATTAVCLPHDWLTWRLRGGGDPVAVTTDRSDASGTGYWSAETGAYRPDLLALAFGFEPAVPRVLAADESPGRTGQGAMLGAGAGDNAAAALGLGAGPGDVVVSIGTSGVVTAVATGAVRDATGIVAGFADATGHFLPLVCTLNAARVLDAAATVLGVDLAGLSDLALRAPAGADGLVLVPYLEGERTPDLPDATGSLQGMTLANLTPAHLARAAVEGVLCGLADGLDALVSSGVTPRRILLIGGGAASEAVRRIAPSILGQPVVVPEPGEYVADGACRQAAWVLAGGDEPPGWATGPTTRYDASARPDIRARYADEAARVAGRRA